MRPMYWRAKTTIRAFRILFIRASRAMGHLLIEDSKILPSNGAKLLPVSQSRRTQCVLLGKLLLKCARMLSVNFPSTIHFKGREYTRPDDIMCKQLRMAKSRTTPRARARGLGLLLRVDTECD